MNDFAGSSAYDLVELRTDLNRFTFLLGTGDGEGLFSAKAEWRSDGSTLGKAEGLRVSLAATDGNFAEVDDRARRATTHQPRPSCLQRDHLQNYQPTSPADAAGHRPHGNYPTLGRRAHYVVAAWHERHVKRWSGMLREQVPYVRLLSMSNVRLTLAVLQVLSIFLEDVDERRYGYDLMRVTGFPSGKLYPILARLEVDGWLIREREDIDPVTEGRPARRFYYLNPDSVNRAYQAVAALHRQIPAPALAPPRPRLRGGEI